MSLSEKIIDIVIVDDHPIVIQGLRTLLEGRPGFSVKGFFTSGAGVIAYLEQASADVVLMDITLPDGSGITFCRKILDTHPDIRVIAISNLNQRSVIQQMMQCGASGYLLKTAEPEDILTCITDVIQGQLAFCREVREMMERPGAAQPLPVPELTKREKQILLLLAEGKTSPDIAGELFISPLTVKTHRATLLQKFNVSNIVALVNRAKEYHLL